MSGPGGAGKGTIARALVDVLALRKRRLRMLMRFRLHCQRIQGSLALQHNDLLLNLLRPETKMQTNAAASLTHQHYATALTTTTHKTNYITKSENSLS